MAGAAAAYQLSPAIYKLSGFETKRIYYIYKNLHDNTQKRPEIAVLGNSVVMNGINCRRLSEGLAGNPVAWNLGSTGQLLSESMLVLEELPGTVKTIILGVHPNMLINPPEELSLYRAIPYKIYGFNISKDIIQAIDENGLKESARNLTTPYWADVLETRASILNSVNSYARRWLRKDLELDRSVENMFYPAPYTKHVSKEATDMIADKLYTRRTAEMGQINPINKRLCNALGEMAKKRDCRFVLIIMPEQPIRKKRDEPAFHENLNRSIEQFAAESKFEVYDCKDLLPEEYFVDFIHPDSEGAKILTDTIREKLSHGRK